MATGTYTSPKRVEREGRLIAFEGEVMTMDEAITRGLVKESKPKPQRKGKQEPEKEPEKELEKESEEE